MSRRVCRLTLLIGLCAGIATPAAAARATGIFAEPSDQSTVNPTFAFSGFVRDSESIKAGISQVDTVHFWALPTDGSPGVFLTAISCDPAALCSFSLTASDLIPGLSYTLVAYAHLVETGAFETAAVSRITIATHPPSDLASLGTTVSGPADIRAPDNAARVYASSVAYDDKHDVFLHVWEHAGEVLGRFIGFDGAVKGEAFTIATEATSNPMKPMAAYSRGAIDDAFFVLYASDAAGAGARNVFAQRVRYTGTGGALAGGAIDVSSFSRDPAHVQAPAGIAFNPVARQFLLSWKDDQDIYARTFTADGMATRDQMLLTDPTPTGCGSGNRATYGDGRTAYDWHSNRYLVLVNVNTLVAPRCTFGWTRNIGVLLDATTLGVTAIHEFCAGFACNDTGSATALLDSAGFLATLDRCCYNFSGLQSDVEALRVTASSRTSLGAAIGTIANDTGGRVQSDPAISRMLVIGLATPFSNDLPIPSTSPSYGLRIAALNRTGVPLTAAVNLTTTPALSSPDLVVARDGTFAASYTTTDGAILHRIGVASDGLVNIPFSNITTRIDPLPAGPTGSSFTISGWSIDFGAPTGTGMSVVEVIATLQSGGPPIVLGATSTFLARPDVVSLVGPRFTNSGFSIRTNGLRAGTYNVIVYARSRYAGRLAETAPITVTVTSTPILSLDVPGSSVAPVFDVGGWAIDLGAGDGQTGIDAVHIYAAPTGGQPVFLGATTPNRPRPDIGSIYGSQFTNSGYRLTTPALAQGNYTLIVYAHSAVSDGWTVQTRAITVRAPGRPAMSLDTPVSGAVVGQPFQVAGWAIDLDAPESQGPGVDVLHVWAFPTDGGPATFAGAATTGGQRNDVGAAFGAQFATAGYNLTVTGLAPGTYQLAVYAHSTVTGTFNQARVITVTVLP
jgi:hypothetical protein